MNAHKAIRVRSYRMVLFLFTALTFYQIGIPGFKNIAQLKIEKASNKHSLSVQFSQQVFQFSVKFRSLFAYVVPSDTSLVGKRRPSVSIPVFRSRIPGAYKDVMTNVIIVEVYESRRKCAYRAAVFPTR